MLRAAIWVHNRCTLSPMTTVPRLAPTDSRDHKRDSYRGFGDGLSRAFELAVTPVIFGGFGYLLDSWLHTRPAFMIGLVVLSVIGLSARMWFGYDQEMRAHETTAGWGARVGPNDVTKGVAAAAGGSGPPEARPTLPTGVTL